VRERNWSEVCYKRVISALLIKASSYLSSKLPNQTLPRILLPSYSLTSSLKIPAQKSTPAPNPPCSLSFSTKTFKGNNVLSFLINQTFSFNRKQISNWKWEMPWDSCVGIVANQQKQGTLIHWDHTVYQRPQLVFQLLPVTCYTLKSHLRYSFLLMF